MQILDQYKGEEPFASYLNKYFAVNKKHGSKDRKHISHLCYSFFRIGRMKMDWQPEERILAGLFLCSRESNEILQALNARWNENVVLSGYEKLSLIGAGNSFQDLFPSVDELSEGVEKEKFIISHLEQPDVFLRLRPQYEDSVKRELKEGGISFEIISDNCLSLPGASKLDSIIELDKEAVVQDYSSQKVGELARPVLTDRACRVWDCCAGSGGKSILLYDIQPQIELTVSDVRESILVNLRKRFRIAGLKNYKCLQADLVSPAFSLYNSNFELILADVPCSGSGTWGRTPEQLSWFDKDRIDDYSALQKKLVSHVVPYLRSGGYLLYVTCSVYKRENEDIVNFIMENFALQPVRTEVLRGYDKKADTMFAALLQKPS